jgi:hypothetical protein
MTAKLCLFTVVQIVSTIVMTAWNTTSFAQAQDDINFTAFDYITMTGNVGENDILPTGTSVFRFLDESQHGFISWVDSTQGIFEYLVDPINIQIYTGWNNGFNDWSYQGPASDRSDYIRYEVCVDGLCDTANIEIFLWFQRDNPVALPDTFYVEAGSTRTLNVGLNDYDPDSLSDPNRGPNRFLNLTLPNNSSATATNPYVQMDGTFTYTPDPGFIGQDNFTYQMIDPLGCDLVSAITNVTIFVVQDNDSPFASQVNLGNINEESTRNQNLAFFTFDPEGENLTYSIVQQGVGGIATVSSNGAFSYTASLNFIGPDTLYYQITDLVGQTAVAAIVLNVVNANNDAPSAPARSYTTTEDSSLSTNIAFIDEVDGDLLSYSIEVNPAFGSASITPDGQLVYVPNANFSGFDLIQYKACDPGSLCDIAEISINVLPVNDAPQVLLDSNEVLINGILNAQLIQNVSDIDSPLNSMTFTLIDNATEGNVVLNANGTYQYTPSPFYYGADSFVYSVCDNSGGCTNASVEITITLVNLPPSAQSTTASLNEDEETLIDLDTPTFDFGNSDLEFSIINSDGIGTFQNVTNAGLLFQPTPNLFGAYTLSYQVCDNGNLCDTAEIAITIIPVNDSPITYSSTIVTEEDAAVTWQANYSDIDSDILLLSILTEPAHGVLNGTEYIPDNNFYGTDLIVFEVCDEYNSCSVDSIELVITSMNDAPIAGNDVLSGIEDEPLVASVSTNDYDIDSETLLYEAINDNNPYNITLLSDGSLEWLPPSNFSGETQFEYRVCDAEGACDTALVVIQIAEINDMPLVNFPAVQLNEDSQTEYSAIYYAFDTEGHALYQSLAMADGIEASLNPETGFILLNASSNLFGDAFVVVNTCDILGACSTDTIHVNILPVNDPPYGFEQTFSTFQNVTFSGSWYNYIFDIDDSALSFEASANFGNTIIADNGTFTYTPSDNYLGQDTILLQACDSSGACINLEFLINILPPNQAPLAQNVEQSLCQSSSITIALADLASDEIDTAGSLIYTFNSSVVSTYTIDTENETLLITPSSFYTGEMLVEFQVCDNASPSLCSAGSISLNVIAITSPQINDVTVNAVSCYGLNDGSIVIESVAESQGVEFAWSNGSIENAIYNLQPGVYTVEMAGLSACSTPATAQFIINEPEALSLELTSLPITAPNAGMIECNASGGTMPYSYVWTGPGNFSSTTSTISNLNDAGTYTLSVSDANGCVIDTMVMITPVEQLTQTDLHVYPNPSAGGTIQINLPSAVHAGQELQVIDAQGRLVLAMPISAETETLNTNEIPAGIYRIIVGSAGLKYSTTCIIIH